MDLISTASGQAGAESEAPQSCKDVVRVLKGVLHSLTTVPSSSLALLIMLGSPK